MSKEQDIVFHPFGRDLFGNPAFREDRGPLAQRFEFPPFSVLNAREGEWQDRKKAWLALGIKSEIGRGGLSGGTTASSRAMELSGGPGTLARTYGSGGPGTLARTYGSGGCRPHVGGALDEPPGRARGEDYKGGDAWVQGANNSGTSIFDPVLCELAYKWFCPPGGQVVDPFAGGSVRGIVAGKLGFKYHGIDLRQEQIDANNEQKITILKDAEVFWVRGDSIAKLQDAPPADFVFSCPPYGDLERYSDDPADLSTMEYHTFRAAYARIILRCAQKLKENRFACFVVGDFRDKRTGHYRGFVSDTVQLFKECGLALYNDAVLLTAVGSLPIRVGKQFESGRKLGKTHQNVLVFVKGDWREAAKAVVA